jgi:hypothetical protein
MVSALEVWGPLSFEFVASSEDKKWCRCFDLSSANTHTHTHTHTRTHTHTHTHTHMCLRIDTQ